MFVLFILCAYTEACNNMQYVQYRLLSLYSYVSGVFTYNLLLCYNLFLMFLAVHAPIRLLTQFSIFWHNIYFLMLLFLVLHNYLCVFLMWTNVMRRESTLCFSFAHRVVWCQYIPLLLQMCVGCFNFSVIILKQIVKFMYLLFQRTLLFNTMCVLLSPSLLLLMTTNCAVSAMFLVTVQTISILCLFWQSVLLQLHELPSCYMHCYLVFYTLHLPSHTYWYAPAILSHHAPVVVSHTRAVLPSRSIPAMPTLCLH